MSTLLIREKIDSLDSDFTARQLSEELNIKLSIVAYVLYRMKIRGEIFLIEKQGFPNEKGGLYGVFNKEYREIEKPEREKVRAIPMNPIDVFNRMVF
jgi:hypothetical protein